MIDDAIPIEDSAPKPAAVAFVVAGVLAAIAIPDVPPGLGMVVVAFATAAAVALARPLEANVDSIVHAGFALVLASAPLFRAAEWVLALDLLAALGLASLAVTRGTRWADLVRAPLAVLARLWTAVGFVGRPLVPSRERIPALAPVARGLAIAGAMLLVFGVLFATADRAFAHLAGRFLLPDWTLDLVAARLIVFGVVVVGAAALAVAGPRYSPALLPPRDPRRRLGRVEWVTALSALDVLFAAFVAVQIAVLFGGRDHVLQTAGLSYAEYARQGFFQLLAVGALTLAVVAGAARWARRETPGQTRLLQALLGLLCLLTLVVLASAFMRLAVYESVFGSTRLRLSVFATILWMAALFLLVLAAGATMRGGWLPRAAVWTTAVGLIVFTAMNPDGVVASKNVERYAETGRIDLEYLSNLSPDAVPALAGLPPVLRRCALWPHADLTERARAAGGWWGAKAREYLTLPAWNYGRVRAMAFVPPRQPAPPSIACRAAARIGLWP